MKKIALFLLFIISNSYLFYAQPYIQWQRSLGGSVDDRAYSIQQTTDGGYIIAGFSNSNDGDVTGNHGDYDYWIVKLNSTGAIEWQKSLGGTGIDWAQSIQQTTNRGYIVAGWSNSNDRDVTGNHGRIDYWIIKLNSTGVIEWQKSLGGTGNENPNSIQLTTDGGYIIAGFSGSNDGDVTGHHGTSISADSWIVKLDSTGAIEWERTLGGTLVDAANSIQQTTDGGYIVAGYSGSNDGDVTGNHGSTDSWIVKLNSTGAIEWQKSLGGTGIDWSRFIQQTTDGGYIVAGHSYSNDGDVTGNHGNDDCWIVKLDNTLAIQWQKSVGGSLGDAAFSIQQTNDGGYIVAGHSDSNDGDVTGNHGASDYWIVKLNAIIGINEIQNSILDFQITPNPFSGETVISFTLSSSKKAEFIIHDIEGRVIKNLNSKNLCNGTNKILWDATNNTGSKVDNGIYFITIVSDNISETKKVVVLRN